jgi:hypothetical protein
MSVSSVSGLLLVEEAQGVREDVEDRRELLDASLR